MTDEQKALVRKLRANRKLRKRLRERLATETFQMDILLTEGKELGVSREQMLKAAGISRWTLYRRMNPEGARWR